MGINNSRTPHIGEVLEWLKRHAWKACIRQKRIAGSNPVLSAFFIYQTLYRKISKRKKNSRFPYVLSFLKLPLQD